MMEFDWNVYNEDGTDVAEEITKVKVRKQDALSGRLGQTFLKFLPKVSM